MELVGLDWNLVNVEKFHQLNLMFQFQTTLKLKHQKRKQVAPKAEVSLKSKVIIQRKFCAQTKWVPYNPSNHINEVLECNLNLLKSYSRNNSSLRFFHRDKFWVLLFFFCNNSEWCVEWTKLKNFTQRTTSLLHCWHNVTEMKSIHDSSWIILGLHLLFFLLVLKVIFIHSLRFSFLVIHAWFTAWSTDFFAQGRRSMHWWESKKEKNQHNQSKINHLFTFFWGRKEEQRKTVQLN
jgi:hypothetical protein